MPNNEHLKILNTGVDTWNEWRIQNPNQVPDLSWASIGSMDLSEINLEYSNLKLAFCRGCNFSNANLKYSNFFGANLENSLFNNTDMVGVNLEGALLKNIILTNTRLIGCNFKLANLEGAFLEHSDITGSKKLKYEQLSKVKSLYKSRMDSSLIEKIREINPMLFNKPN